MTRLEQARIDRGLTISALADVSGVKRQTIAALESGGTVKGRADTLFALGTALGVRPSELLRSAVFPAETGEAA